MCGGGQPPPWPLTNLMHGRQRVLLAKVKIDSIRVSGLANSGLCWPAIRFFSRLSHPCPPPLPGGWPTLASNGPHSWPTACDVGQSQNG